jgi:hypothetical protein
LKFIHIPIPFRHFSFFVSSATELVITFEIIIVLDESDYSSLMESLVFTAMP